jgi:DNA polymerase-1
MKQVLVDVSFLAHRARHALQGFEFDDLPTGVMYGFFEQIKTIAFNPKILSNQIHLFFDSRKSHRRLTFPDYKKKRQEDRTPEEIEQIQIMHEQLRTLRTKHLPRIGFPIYRQTGLESDDLMAYAAQRLCDPVIIVTADQDLCQCISHNVTWYDPGRDKWFDPHSFYEEKRVDPKEWVDVKALAGCSSDNVPGVPGIGEKSAIDYLHGFLPRHWKKFERIKSEEGEQIRWRNDKLVRLPHSKTKSFEVHSPRYHVEAFWEFCEEYGIESYLSGKQKRLWENFFQNEITAQGMVARKRGEKRGKRQGQGFGI